MISEFHDLLDKYHLWLKEKTTLRQVNDWVEITTPYLDRHNDYLQIYVKPDEGGYVLMDDGYILEDLETSGCKLDSPKRQELLHTVLNGYGIKIVNGTLQVRATNESFALRKHNLLQAMLSVNDMFYLAQPAVASLYCEDVANWLDYHEIRYTPRVKFTGKTSFDYMFDFAIPKSKTQPERLIKAITNPNRDSAQSAILSWHDTREVRPHASRFYAVLNDAARDIPSTVIEALRSYDVVVVPWSKRDDVWEELAA